jgi:hypothetical protein
LVEPKSSLSLLFVIGLVENPIHTVEKKNFFVTLPCPCHLLSLLSRRLLSEEPPVSLELVFYSCEAWLFYHPVSYVTMPSAFLQWLFATVSFKPVSNKHETFVVAGAS